MPRDLFNRELQQVQDEMLVMASMVEKAIERSVASLKSRDPKQAQQVIDDDFKINQQRFGIEEDCLLLIATQQPIASDLRIIAAVLNIITDLERMGDHAEGIATISIMIGDESLLKPLIDVPRMAEKDAEMLRRALLSFGEHDAATARHIAAVDDDIDALDNHVHHE